MTGLNDMNLNNHFSDVNDQRTKVEQPQLATKRALMDSHTKLAVMDTHEQTTAHLHYLPLQRPQSGDRQDRHQLEQGSNLLQAASIARFVWNTNFASG